MSLCCVCFCWLCRCFCWLFLLILICYLGLSIFYVMLIPTRPTSFYVYMCFWQLYIQLRHIQWHSCHLFHQTMISQTQLYVICIIFRIYSSSILEQSLTFLFLSQIFVGCLDPNVTEEELKQICSQFGDIIYVKIPAGKGCGFVQFVAR